MPTTPRDIVIVAHPPCEAVLAENLWLYCLLLPGGPLSSLLGGEDVSSPIAPHILIHDLNLLPHRRDPVDEPRFVENHVAVVLLKIEKVDVLRE